MRNLASVTIATMLGLGLVTATAPTQAVAQFSVGIEVGFAPPPLPIYDQPPIPGYGYIWTPGYWAWDDYQGDYFWVPGTWVRPPRIGLYWTPAYWAFHDGYYEFVSGFWGPTVGFYGGINYGFGYGGFGYEGGIWRGDRFFYNAVVNNVRYANISTVYQQRVFRNDRENRVSYNGGPAGVRAQPTREQLSLADQPHLAPTPVQLQHFQLARSTPDLRAGLNRGAPPIAATAQPGQFRGSVALPAFRSGMLDRAPRPPVPTFAARGYDPRDSAYRQTYEPPRPAAPPLDGGRTWRAPPMYAPQPGPHAGYGQDFRAGAAPPSEFRAQPAFREPGPPTASGPAFRGSPQAGPAANTSPQPESRPSPASRAEPRPRDQGAGRRPQPW